MACSIHANLAVLHLLPGVISSESRVRASPKDPGQQPLGGSPWLLPSSPSTRPPGPRLPYETQESHPAAARLSDAILSALTSDAPGTFPAAGPAWRGGGAERGARMRHSASTLPGSCGGLSLSAGTAPLALARPSGHVCHHRARV